MRVAIIGGGIAGLACAYELELVRRGGLAVEYELFEAGSRLGGVISSSVVDGTVIERGPDSFLTEKPAAAALCRELGLEASLMGSNDAERKTFIVVRNRLVPLPDGLMFLVPTKLVATLFTPLFSWTTKLRMGLELLQSPQSSAEDESVAALVRRHYGQGVVDRLADPLLSGIYGGDATQLSAQSVMPRMVEMEAKYGSLTRGMLAGMRTARQARKQAELLAENEEAAAERAAKPPIFTTLRFGLQQLVDGLTGEVNLSKVHLRTPVSDIERAADGGWLLRTASASTQFDAVVIATPAWAAAELLRNVDIPLADALAEIPYSSSATVNLVYDGADLDPLPEGFGFLVPASEGRAMLACTLIHRKFPGRTAMGKSVLRAFLGGAGRAALLEEPDEALVERVRRELFEMLRISAVPELTEVTRWPKAMAQYSVGHEARIARIRQRTASLPNLHLVGNAYDGIGISDCIRLGREAAREIVRPAMRPDARATAQSHR